MNVIPVEVLKNDQKNIWYIDISSLGIESLINLKKELIGLSHIGVMSIDEEIYSIVGSCYCDNNSHYFKERKKEEKIKRKRKVFDSEEKKWRK